MKKHAGTTRTTAAALTACLAFGLLASPTFAREGQDQSPPAGGLKSENKALVLSLAGTLVPWSLFLGFGFRESHEPGANTGEVLAVISFFWIPFGPSLGYFYAGSKRRAWAGIGIRLAGLAAFCAGVGIALNDETGSSFLPGALVVGGGLATIISTVTDLAGVKRAVRARNLKARETGLAVAPILSPGSKTVGLSVRFSF